MTHKDNFLEAARPWRRRCSRMGVFRYCLSMTMIVAFCTFTAVAQADMCCSLDHKHCASFDGDYCHASATNCASCMGHYIVKETIECQARWETCNDDDESCCGETVCVQGMCDRPSCCTNTMDSMDDSCDEDCSFSATECADCGGNWVQRLDVDTPRACCSQTFAECMQGADSAWCRLNPTHCEQCSARWMILPTSSDCAPRWTGCASDGDCCEPSLCIRHEDGWQMCDLPPNKCCSFDQKTCADEASQQCHESLDSCASCHGHYIDPTATTCTARGNACDSTTDCCGDTMCSENGLCERPFCCRTDDLICSEDAACDYSAADCTACGGAWEKRAATPLALDAPLPTHDSIPAGYSERIVIPEPASPKVQDRSSCPHHAASGLLDWNDAATWPNGLIPAVAGENFMLPENTNVVLRESISIRLGLVTIPATSSLIIGENDNGIALHVNGILVLGALVLGSETCPLETPVTITLHGTRPTNAVTTVPVETYKGIAVEGTLHVHGKRYFRTWTRLSRNAQPGDTQVFLQHTTNWEPEQEIVLVTTAMKDARDWHQNEVHTIMAREGTVLTLESPVQHLHLATKGYQAEVGLLSRTIVIQGSQEDSEPTDPDPHACTGDRSWFGDTSIPCPYTELSGFGGHVIVHKGGKGYVEGVEFFRMGMTNVLGRYPIHFHLLGEGCDDCYVKASSFHRSYYRCVSVHGTNGMLVSENVAYDVSGYCYYLEDGVEERNTISFNLAAFIHPIGPAPPTGYAQTTDVYQQSDRLTLPADVTASGFYITNVHNNLIGNSASGGYAGFAFPILPTALQSFREKTFRPSSVSSLTLDGNTAHSTGWWWVHAGAFYFGGSLYYNKDDVLEYNPGRDFDFEDRSRRPCNVNACARGDCAYGCPKDQVTSIRMTNTKTFQVSGTGFNSWSGSMEVIGYESHDVGLSIEALSDGFWIDDMLVVCRTGESLNLPPSASAKQILGNGFQFYDTGQEHIVTRSTFRQCGYRSDEFSQYNTSPDRGCQETCSHHSTVFGLLTHSDEFTPELMQGTRDISFENCGRRFYFLNYKGDEGTVSGRGQNWLDVDGTVSGLNEPTLIVSGIESVRSWTSVDDDVELDPQGPLRFIRANGGPRRGLGHFRMIWDEAVNGQVGSSTCGNGDGSPCPTLGHVRHAGRLFSNSPGLPVTARGDIVGPVGGFGWILELDAGAPREIRFEHIEVLPETPMFLSIPYPSGTTFTITAHASQWCPRNDRSISCEETFRAVSSMDEVKSGPGNQYYVDPEGVVTFRIIQTPQNFVGRPEWFVPSKVDPNRVGRGKATERFERGGVYLPRFTYGPYYMLEATCGGTGPYCSGQIPRYDPVICEAGCEQKAYDRCCVEYQPEVSMYATPPASKTIGKSLTMLPIVSVLIVLSMAL